MGKNKARKFQCTMYETFEHILIYCLFKNVHAIVKDQNHEHKYN